MEPENNSEAVPHRSPLQSHSCSYQRGSAPTWSHRVRAWRSHPNSVSTGYVLKTSWYGSAGSCQQVCDHVTIEPHSSWFAVVSAGREPKPHKPNWPGRRESESPPGDCEHELGRPSFGTLGAIREALERAGVEFTNGKKPGVRLDAPNPKEHKRPSLHPRP